MDCKNKVNQTPCYYTKLKLMRSPLLAYTFARISNKQEAEDIVQNVLIILAQKKDDYDSSKSFYNWAMQICYFQIRASLTKSKRNQVRVVENIENESKESIGFFCSKMPFQDIIQREKKNIESEVSHILSNLERKVFSLTIKGWSADDIAYSLKITRNHYLVTKSRTIKKLRNFLKNQSLEDYKS